MEQCESNSRLVDPVAACFITQVLAGLGFIAVLAGVLYGGGRLAARSDNWSCLVMILLPVAAIAAGALYIRLL